MDRGLREIHVDCITTDQVRKIIEVTIILKSYAEVVTFSIHGSYTVNLYFHSAFFHLLISLQIVEGNEKSTFNLVQFSAIAAFSERLLFSETQ